MRVCVWLLWVSWFCTCAEYSKWCKCHGIVPAEPGLDKRSKTLFKERAHHSGGHQHTPHRNRAHRRKERPPRIVHHPSDVVVKVGNPATLSCRADGSPKPTIEWLRNNQLLETAKRDGQLQPMILSDGSLFFLSVEGGRQGQSHEGVYTCVARNSAGKDTSRNASLFIALKEEFSMQPTDVEVAEGEMAVLTCSPPVGHPEPNVVWKKDGLPISSADHHYTKLNGKLIIGPAEKSHSGAYVCAAINTVGERESRAARLSVLKPVLVLKPENVSVRAGESAQFYCQAKGDPPPAVVWSREQGPLPNGYIVNPDQTLQIHYVTALDAGKYTCTALNDVGVVTASAQLLVEPEAANTEQKDLHKELSSLRVILENVTVMAPDSNMSFLQWKSLPAQPHYLDGFEVLYRSLLTASSDWAAEKVTFPSFQAQVGPLKRGYKYDFKVRPYGSGLYGRESNTRHLRVSETPSASPRAVSVTVNHEQNNTIHLSWEPPPPVTHNGILQGYQQVWCVEPEEQQYQNWTVDSSQLSLHISSLKQGKQYWVTIAAVNGAGVGMLSDPHGFVIQDPVLLGSIGAVLWCVLMGAAICLFRHHSRTGQLIPRPGKAKLRRLAGEDLIIKHMAAPDSPWIPGGWRPSLSQKYHDLWAQGQHHPGIRSTSSKKDSSCLESTVPIVTDSCGVYGTFYVDLMGSGLKTFNSPGRVTKMSHGLPHKEGAETIQIFTHPASKPSPIISREALPWKQAIRPQPKMGVLRESWEKGKPVGCPRLLHYSASLHLMNMLLPPPPVPTEDATDTQSLTSDGSSRSTKLTMDMGSLQSVCPASGPHGQLGPSNKNICPSYSHLCTALSSVSQSDEQGSMLTAQEAAEYLELTPKPERCALPEQRPSLSRHFASTLNYICGPTRSAQVHDAFTEPEPPLNSLRHACRQSSPSSCYSEWDSSLWNTISSVMDSNLSSARTSLISSVDSCYTNDSANFAHLLAMAAESMSGASFLSACLPPQRLVPIFPCRRRLIRRTGACFCLGLEHGLDGGNGGP
uniref:Roundabout, axon guidance receptor, homolog 4 (Drosophila) n=1 Tax=Maylandia zebra TaxID=106582 RepID=A0A3P9DBB3_9CICH